MEFKLDRYNLQILFSHFCVMCHSMNGAIVGFESYFSMCQSCVPVNIRIIGYDVEHNNDNNDHGFHIKKDQALVSNDWG